jgi:hypothetical protein
MSKSNVHPDWILILRTMIENGAKRDAVLVTLNEIIRRRRGPMKRKKVA